jgi:repressor of nif and glnA expression
MLGQIQYFFFMSEKTEKKELAILRLLQKAGGPVSSLRLKENLHAMGHEVSERTIRHYFLELDRRGLTENRGKKGRVITEQGLKELGSARVYDKVGLLAAKIDQLTYRMSFDLYKKSGTVIINVSIAKLEQLPEIVPLVTRVYAAGYSMGTMMAIFEPGERVGGLPTPVSVGCWSCGTASPRVLWRSSSMKAAAWTPLRFSSGVA